MTFEFDKDTGHTYYDDGDTQYFVHTNAKNQKDAWKETHRAVRKKSRPVPYLRLVFKEV